MAGHFLLSLLLAFFFSLHSFIHLYAACNDQCRVCFKIKPYDSSPFVSFDFMILQRYFVTSNETQNAANNSNSTAVKSISENGQMRPELFQYAFVVFSLLFMFMQLGFFFPRIYQSKKKNESTHQQQLRQPCSIKRDKIQRQNDCVNQLKHIYGFAIEELVSIINLLCRASPLGCVH